MEKIVYDQDGYQIVETSCYPKPFQVIYKGFQKDNTLFFETEDKALDYIIKQIEGVKKRVRDLLQSARTKAEVIRKCEDEFGKIVQVMAMAHYSDNKWHEHNSGRRAMVCIHPHVARPGRVTVTI